MFYLLPWMGNRCCSKDADPQEIVTEHTWTKLEASGLLLDITLIVGLCIVASLTVCVHAGVPLGSLNALSAINIPALSALWVGAALLTMIDIVIGSYCLSPKPPQLTLQYPDSQAEKNKRPKREADHKEVPQKPKRKKDHSSASQGDGAAANRDPSKAGSKKAEEPPPPIPVPVIHPQPEIEKPSQADVPQAQPGTKRELKRALSAPDLTSDRKKAKEPVSSPIPKDANSKSEQPPAILEVPQPVPPHNPELKKAEEPVPAPTLERKDAILPPDPELKILDPEAQHPKPEIGQPPAIPLEVPQPVPPHNPEPKKAEEPVPAPTLERKDAILQLDPDLKILDPEAQQPKPEKNELLNKRDTFEAQPPHPLNVPSLDQQQPKPEIGQPPAIPLEVPQPVPLHNPELKKAAQQLKGIDTKDNEQEELPALETLQQALSLGGDDPFQQIRSNPPSPRLVVKEPPPKKVANQHEEPIEVHSAIPTEEYDLDASIMQFMQPEKVPDLFGDSQIFDTDEPAEVVPIPQKSVGQPQGLFGHLGTLASYGIQGLQTIASSVWSFASSFKKPGNVQTRFYKAQIGFILEKFFGYNEKRSDFVRFQFRSFEKKIKALKAKKFEDKGLAALQATFLQTIETYKDDLSSMKYHLLCAIETAYFKNREASEGDAYKDSLAEKEYSEPLDLFLKKLGYELFTNFDAIQYGRSAMKSLLPRDTTTPLSFGNIAGVIREDQKQTSQLNSDQVGTFLHDQQGRARGAVGVAFYPLLENNFANFLWEESYRDGHTVKVIRFGTPTSQDVKGNVSILGKMHAFMRECESRGETAVCFEHQALSGADGSRAHKMLNLANNVYSKNLYFIHLDMDSAFFKQKQAGIDIDTQGQKVFRSIDDFKADVANHVFKLPKSDNLADFNARSKEDLKAIADEVQRRHFAGKTQLSQEERQDFIMEYYVLYRKYVHETLKPTFSFDKCKDTQDRSMSILNLGYLNNQMELGKHQDPQTLEDFRVLCTFVGLIVKGSPMDHERFMRFITVVERWTTQEVPKMKTTLANQVIKVSQGLEYTYSTLPSEAATKEEYLASDLFDKKDPVLIGVIEENKNPDDRAKELIRRVYANSKMNEVSIFIPSFAYGKTSMSIDVTVGKKMFKHFMEGSIDKENNLYVQFIRKEEKLL